MADETLIDDKAKAQQPRKRAAKLIGIGLGVIAAVAGGLYYLHSRNYESTDNAFIEGDVIQVSPRVAGQMVRVYVQDNQHVNGGDLIAEIDARDYAARAAEASARLADTSARADGAKSNLALTSTVTNAVLIQTGAAADGAQDQVQILQAPRAGCRGDSRSGGGHGPGRSPAIRRPGGSQPCRRGCRPLPGTVCER